MTMLSFILWLGKNVIGGVIFFYNSRYERNSVIFKDFIYFYTLFGLTVKLYNYI